MTLIGHGVLAEEHARVAGTITYELVCGIESCSQARAPCRPRCVSAFAELLAGEDAWVVGGAVRDELLGLPVLDLDVVSAPTRSAPHGATPPRWGGAPFPLSGRHGAWRVVARRRADGRLQPAPRRLDRGRPRRPRLHGQRDRRPGRRRRAGRPVRRARRPRSAGCCGRSPTASSTTTPFACCAPSGSRTSAGFGSTRTARRLVRGQAAWSSGPAGERILDELLRLSAAGYERLDRARACSSRSAAPPARGFARSTRPGSGSSLRFGAGVRRLPVPSELRRFAAVLRAPSRRRTARPAPSTGSAARPSRGRSRRLPSPARASSPGRSARPARGEPAGAAPARRRARHPAGPESWAACWSGSPRSGRRARSRRGRRRWSLSDDRWSRTADRLAALRGEPPRRADASACGASSQPRGDERALDSGAGHGRARLRAGAARRRGGRRRPRRPSSSTRPAARAARCRTSPSSRATRPGSDLERRRSTSPAARATLHHIHRPELVVAELARVTRPGGRVLVIDQIAPADPWSRSRVDRFERARDPTHERLLPTSTCGALLEANGLVVCATDSPASGATSTAISTSPAARARRATGRAALAPPAYAPSSAGTWRRGACRAHDAPEAGSR